MDRPPYARAARLIAAAGQFWPLIDAENVQADVLSLRVDRFLNVVYAWCVVRVKEGDREMFEAQLDMPLDGEEPTEEQLEDEGAGFMAAMQQLTGG